MESYGAMEIIRYKDIKRNKGAKYLIDHLIPARDLTVVWGKPKSGKTFWVLDAAAHIAAGLPYRGRTTMSGPALYCAFEGAFMFPIRMHAAMQGLGLRDKDIPLFYSPERHTFTKVGGSYGVVKAIKEFMSELPVLVVLDTLNRSLDGSESSDEDMTHYTRCAEDISRECDCAVIVVHHCGIAGDRPRGHTSLTGTCASQIRIERASKVPISDGQPMMISATVEFMKDGPEGAVEYSWIKPTTITYEDGDIEESSYIEPAPTPTEGVNEFYMVGHTKKALSVLQEGVGQTDSGRITMAEWRTRFELVCKGTKKDTVTKAFYRSYEMLKKEGVVMIDGQWVSLVRSDRS